MDITEIIHHLDKMNCRLQSAEYQNREAKITLYRVMTNNYQQISDELAEKIEKASIDYAKTGIRLIGKDLEIIAEINVGTTKPINPEEGD